MGLKQTRKDLISRSKHIVRDCRKHVKVVTKAAAADALSGKQLALTSVTGTSTIELTVKTTASDKMLILAQADLIQECHTFLSSVFAYALTKCLRNPSLTDRLPRQLKVPACDLVLSKQSITVQRICEILTEDFSFINFERRNKILNKIFNQKVNEDVWQHLSKHVVIRNLFQHHRGILRREDLERLHKPEGIYLLDQHGTEKKYILGNKIHLSLPELENLLLVIDQYSQYYEVLT